MKRNLYRVRVSARILTLVAWVLFYRALARVSNYLPDPGPRSRTLRYIRAEEWTQDRLDHYLFPDPPDCGCYHSGPIPGCCDPDEWEATYNPPGWVLSIGFRVGLGAADCVD